MDKIILQTRTGTIITTYTTLMKIPYFNSFLERWDNREDKTEPIYIDDDQQTMTYILKMIDSIYYKLPKNEIRYISERLKYYGITNTNRTNITKKRFIASFTCESIKSIYRYTFRFGGKRKKLEKIVIRCSGALLNEFDITIYDIQKNEQLYTEKVQWKNNLNYVLECGAFFKLCDYNIKYKIQLTSAGHLPTLVKTKKIIYKKQY